MFAAAKGKYTRHFFLYFKGSKSVIIKFDLVCFYSDIYYIFITVTQKQMENIARVVGWNRHYVKTKLQWGKFDPSFITRKELQTYLQFLGSNKSFKNFQGGIATFKLKVIFIVVIVVGLVSGTKPDVYGPSKILSNI